MRVKISIILAVIVAAAVAAAATPAQASATNGYTCKYRIGGLPVSVVIDGYDNGRLFCRAFNSNAHGRMFYGPARGRLQCRLRLASADVRVSVYSNSRLYGSVFCRLASKVDGFVRVR